MLEFDPNEPKKAPKPTPYATYIPNRTPQFKLHSKRNHATNAINAKCGEGGYPGVECIMYEWIDERWEEIDRYIPPTNCDHCGRDLREAAQSARNSPEYYKHGRFGMVWRPYGQNISPRYKNKVVCVYCYTDHFSYTAKDYINSEWIGQVSSLG